MLSLSWKVYGMQDIAFLQAWADPELEAALGYDDWGMMRRAHKRGAARLRLLQSA